jgi:L-cystine transport system substrate-binding protein
MLKRTFIAACLSAALGLVGTVAPMAAHAADYKANLLEPGTLVVGTTGASPPATMYNDQAELAGYDIDLAKQLGKDLGLKVKFVTLGWSTMMAGIQAGRFDVVISSVGRTPDRVKSADFLLSDPYVVNGVAGAKRAGDNSIHGWKDVCGKKVGVIKGANEIKAAQAKLPAGCLSDIREYPGWSELLLDLQNGRVDLLVGNYLTPAYMINSAHRPLAMLGDSLQVSTSAVVIRKEEPALQQQINTLIAKYRADGQLEKITDKWVGKSLPWSEVKD